MKPKSNPFLRFALVAATAIALGATSVHANTITTSWDYYTATGSGDTPWVAPASTTSVLAIDWGTAGSGTATTWGGINWVGSNATGEAKNDSGSVKTYFSKPGVAWGTTWGDNTFYPSSSFPLLGSGVTGEDDYKLEIGGLNPGQTYQIQFVLADSRALAAPDDDRSVTISGTAGTTGTATNYRYGYSDGKYAVITANVIADAGGYAAFKPSGFNDNGSIGQQINAMQVLAVNNASLNWTAGTGTWSSTANNWTGGVAWTDSTADAILNNASSATAITIDGTQTAATVLVGNSAANNARYTFSGGTLNASAFIVQGADANDPGVGATTLNNVNLTTVGDVGVGRWDLVIGGSSSVTIGGQLRSTSNGAGSGDWGRVTIQDTANVIATGGVSSSGAAWGLTLNGGTLTTPSIQAVENGYGAGSRLTLNGATMIPTQDTGSFISVSSNQAYVGNSGAKFDTNGKNITVGVNLVDTSGQNGTLTKLGTGTLTLTAANSYSGTTTISAGTLQLSGNGTLGSGVVSLKGGTLDLGTTTQSLGTALNASGTGNGAVGTITSGTLNLNGKNAYLQSGTFTMNLTGGGSSRLWIGGDANATVELGGNNTLTYSDSNSTIIGHSTTGTAGTVKLLSATALGPASQTTQVHTGTLDLNGQTGVSVGKIALSNTSHLVNTKTGTAASFGGTVDLTGVTTHNIGGAGDMTLSGVLQSGGFTKTGNGTLTLTNASNTYSGLTTVNSGALNISSAGNLASGNALTVGASGTADFANAGQTLGAVDNSNTATNALNFSASTGTITLGSLAGAGNTRFGSNGTVTGGISTGTVNAVGLLTASISGGTVGAGSLSSTTVSGGTSTVGGVATIGTMSAGTANLNGTTSAITTLNGGTVNLGSSTVLTVSEGTTSGSITGSAGSLTKTGAGTLTLTGANTYTGATTVNSGTLKLQTGSAPLLTDNFTATGNPNTADLNYNLANRQTGSAATTSWTGSGNAQVGNATNVQQPSGTNGDYLLLAFGAKAKLGDLNLSTSNVAGPVKINFDMFKGNISSGGNENSWTSFTLRGSGDGWPVAGSGEFGFLYRNNTGVQVFNNGSAMESFTSTSGGDSFAFYLADSAGTGSPFAGNGTRVIVMQGENLLGSYALNTGMGTTQIAFGSDGTGGNGMIGGVDNLGVNNFRTNVLDPATAVSLSASGATLELDGVIQTVASLSGVSGSLVKLGPLSQLTVNGTANTSFGGVISGTLGGLTKSGSGTLTLSGSNSYNGGTRIVDGTLVVGNDNALGTGLMTLDGGSLASSEAGRLIANDITVKTSTIGQITGDTITFTGLASGTGTLNVNLSNASKTMTVNPTSGEFAPGEIKLTQGTLVLGSSNKIGDNTKIDLAGGTFNVNEKTDTVGALTLSQDSKIDFNSSATASTITFSSLENYTSGKMLTIMNWSGGYSGGTYTHLVISGNPGVSFLGNVQFDGYSKGATWNAGELAPIPEPATIIGAFAFLGLVVLRERRRLTALAKMFAARPRWAAPRK